MGALALLALIGSAKTGEANAQPESDDQFRLSLEAGAAEKKAAEYGALMRAIADKIFKPQVTMTRFAKSPTVAIVRQCRAEISNLDRDLAALEAMLVLDFSTGGAK